MQMGNNLNISYSFMLCLALLSQFRDQVNVKAVTLAPPNPIVNNAKWDLRSDRFDL